MGYKTYERMSANNMVKDKKKSAFQLRALLVKVVTQIQRINVFLREEEIEDKELTSKINLLNRLLETKKKLEKELEKCQPKTKKGGSALGELLEDSPSGA